MKNIFFNTFVFLIIKSFTFSPMKGVYLQKDQINAFKIDRLDQNNCGLYDKINLFICDINSGNALSSYIDVQKHVLNKKKKILQKLRYLEPMLKNKERFLSSLKVYMKENSLSWWARIEKKAIKNREKLNLEEEYYTSRITDFLQGNFNYDIRFWTKRNLEKMKGVYKKKFLLNEQDKTTNKLNEYPIRFQKSFMSFSKVKVSNVEEGVSLNKDGKKLDFTTELLCEYFKMMPSLTTYIDFECLKNSRILAIWCLVPEPNKKEEHQMMGLAEDKATGKLFHWTTDLGQDISNLMQNT